MGQSGKPITATHSSLPRLSMAIQGSGVAIILKGHYSLY